jgi:hypothetical protein
VRRKAALGVGIFVVAAGFLPLISFSDTVPFTCPDGSASHAATAAEAASGSNGGITAGVTQLCASDAKLGINAQVGEAKQYLKSLPGGSSANIDKLNDPYAVCAAKFLKAYQSMGGSVTILAAYRSPDDDARMCQNNPNCGALMNKPASQQTGNHQRGLAMDVRAANQTQMNQFAKSNPSFGVCFPFSLGGVTGTGREDTVHMIPVGGPGSEASGAGCAGVQNTCGVGTNVPVQQGSPSIASAMQQTGGLLSGINSILNPPQPVQCPAGYLLLNGTCVPQQAMAASQTQNPYSYLSSTPASSVTPTSSVIPSTTGGTTDTSNTNSNTNASSAIGNLGSNVMSNDNSSGGNISGMLDGGSQSGSGSSTSAIDLINQIANPTTTDNGSPTQQATGTPVQLGSNLNDEVTLHGTPVSLNGSTQGSSSAYQLSQNVSQTFVSQDLSKSPVNNYAPQQPVNSTFAILEDLKQKLLYIIAFLQPFGGVMPRTSTVSNSTTAFME